MRPPVPILLVLAAAIVPFGGLGCQELPELSAFAAARTERLLQDRWACLGCHRLDGRGGEIGPPLDGVAERLGPDAVLGMIRDPESTLPGTRMPRQPMPEREARRLAAYLVSREARGAGTAPSTRALAPAPEPASGPPNGAALYARHCAPCHGEAGRGDGWNAPNLPVQPTAHADSAVMSRRPDDTLFDAIHSGGWVLDGSPRMPAFGELLSAEEIRALVRHIRALCACEGPAWSRDGEVGR